MRISKPTIYHHMLTNDSNNVKPKKTIHVSGDIGRSSMRVPTEWNLVKVSSQGLWVSHTSLLIDTLIALQVKKELCHKGLWIADGGSIGYLFSSNNEQQPLQFPVGGGLEHRNTAKKINTVSPNHTRTHSTANNFISPNTAAWKTQTSHTVRFENTATPQIEILFTASKKHQHCNTANPHVLLLF